MDNYLKNLIKERIREAVWEGMEKASGVYARENPYTANELLEQQQGNLNLITEQCFSDINEQVLENLHDN